MSKILDQCTIENGNVHYDDFTFKLKYLIFGSKNSLTKMIYYKSIKSIYTFSLINYYE